MGRKRAGGGAPWTPGFMARLLPLARFGVCATLSRSWGYFAAHLPTLIWRLSFIKCFFSIFFPENAFQIGFRIPEEIAPRTDPGQQSPKRASANERPLTQGGRGPSPATLCVRAFSRESLDPPPGTGREPTPQVPTCAGPNPDHLPGAARCCVPSGGVPPKPPWGAAPRCPPGPGRGIRAFSRESPDAKSRGGGPPPPFSYGPLAAARSFWGRVPHCSGRWAITVPIYVP